ncbi:MAG: 50S ribosomal protein L24 [Nanoarchaeota archaeon]|nr:50S ribosomal protein L24 [Nanoarchaeota archaeon]
MTKCSFCKKNYEIPRGITFVLPNGDVLYFCSSKCQKNHKLGRRGDRRKWVIRQKKVKGENEGTKVEEKKKEEGKTEERK